MIILLLGTIVLLLAMNMVYAEFRFQRKPSDINLASRYSKLLLMRRYK